MLAARKCLLLLLALLILLVAAACSAGTAAPDVSPPEEPSNNVTDSADAEAPEAAAQPPQTADEQAASSQETAETTPAPEDKPPAGQPEQIQPPPAETPTPAPQTPVNTPDNTVHNPPSPSPAIEAPQDDGPVILTICGNGVDGETTWTLGQLQSMRDGYRENRYSTTNNWPSFGYMTAHGISLPYLLRQAGLSSDASSFKFIANDGYHTTLTYDQVFGGRYTYVNHSPAGSIGAATVESIVAWEWGDSVARPENIRPFFGQSGPMDVNTASFVKDLAKIEVSTASAGVWEAPAASIADGDIVPAGTELSLMHEYMDSIRVYYTLDGSEPDYNSLVYNRSTSFFQPHLIVPIILTESVTIKAFAAGFSRDASPVVTFSYVVE